MRTTAIPDFSEANATAFNRSYFQESAHKACSLRAQSKVTSAAAQHNFVVSMFPAAGKERVLGLHQSALCPSAGDTAG